MKTDPELLSVRTQIANLVIAYQADRSKNCFNWHLLWDCRSHSENKEALQNTTSWGGHRRTALLGTFWRAFANPVEVPIYPSEKTFNVNYNMH
ncbi:MAG: hypothetical protein BBJ57_06850 [Desulfobacterales bacterium PC51MH44]|nr:MAG: hypothetical protein BBJ57_06850 [Desulfobacterales bacterium PC51MH44]